VGLYFNKLLAPKYCYQFVRTVQPWLALGCVLLFILGLFLSLAVAPADYQQGNFYRIMFVHVPAAVLSLGVYLVMTVSTVIYLVWKIKVADIVAKVSAPIGAMFVLTTLVTGALWGRPTWGTFWIWDARLTSELVLLFIYFGIISLRTAIPQHDLAAKACGLLTIIGVVNIPIVHFSVVWWNTLHQGATLLQFAKPNISPLMLYPLLIMLLAFVVFYLYLLVIGMQAEFLQRREDV